MLKNNQDLQFSELALRTLNNWPKNFDQRNSKITYTIGLSGGVDSVVLLHVFHQLQNLLKFNLNAVHINHNISPNAKNWQEFCGELCAQLNIKLTIYNKYITRYGGESLENNARKLRYLSFMEYYKANAHFNESVPSVSPIILLAHHQNDQVETILGQIFRGTDLHNIAAMHPISKKGKYQQIFWRPFLNISKQDILEHAKQYNLDFIEDESNTNTSYLRNFIRHDIIPQLENWDQNISRKLLKLNDNIKNAVTLIDDLASIDLNSTLHNQNNMNNLTNSINTTYTDHTPNHIQLDTTRFKQLTSLRQQNLISYFITAHKLPLPSSNQIAEFCRQIDQGSWESKPELVLSNNLKIKKYKNIIFIS